MEKSICLSCGFVFDYAFISYESRGEHFGTPCYEEICCCPLCHGDDISKSFNCLICNEWSASDCKNDDTHYCKSCKSDILSRFKSKLSDFSQNEIDFLNELYDVKL